MCDRSHDQVSHAPGKRYNRQLRGSFLSNKEWVYLLGSVASARFEKSWKGCLEVQSSTESKQACRRDGRLSIAGTHDEASGSVENGGQAGKSVESKKYQLFCC